MMEVTGEEGVTLENFITYQKALFLDIVYLQQDAFDPEDVSTPFTRQQASFERITRLVERNYVFEDKEEARDFFTRLTGLYKNLNYTDENSPDHAKYLTEIHDLVTSISEQV
jgi:V/A-type H+/Na+-transporting ATPase subunit A